MFEAKRKGSQTITFIDLSSLAFFAFREAVASGHSREDAKLMAKATGLAVVTEGKFSAPAGGWTFSKI